MKDSYGELRENLASAERQLIAIIGALFPGQDQQPLPAIVAEISRLQQAEKQLHRLLDEQTDE